MGKQDAQAKQPRLSSISFCIKLSSIGLQSRLCSTILLLNIFHEVSSFVGNVVINPDRAKWLITQKRDSVSGITSTGHIQRRYVMSTTKSTFWTGCTIWSRYIASICLHPMQYLDDIVNNHVTVHKTVVSIVVLCFFYFSLDSSFEKNWADCTDAYVYIFQLVSILHVVSR